VNKDFDGAGAGVDPGTPGKGELPLDINTLKIRDSEREVRGKGCEMRGKGCEMRGKRAAAKGEHDTTNHRTTYLLNLSSWALAACLSSWMTHCSIT
jgi:hypothetical protein